MKRVFEKKAPFYSCRVAGALFMIVALFLGGPSTALAEDYYVAPHGSSANSGSEASPWSWTHALATAQAGDTVFVRAGLYSVGSQNNDGSAAHPIRFIGYQATPGDVTASRGSTFERSSLNVEPSASDMPLIRGTDAPGEWGLIVLGEHVSFENFQFENLEIGIIDDGVETHLKNIIVNSCSRGMSLRSTDGGIVEDCFLLNGSGEHVNIYGGIGYVVRYTTSWTDDPAPQYPGDAIPLVGYHFLASGTARDNVFEQCTAYRIPETSGPEGSYHQGHGFDCKAGASFNTFRNSIAYNTGIEVNFGDVHDNLFESIDIYGEHTKHDEQFSAGISIKNGAHDNIFRNIYVEDSRYPVAFVDNEDGFVPEPDTDLVAGGSHNVFVNLVSNGSSSLVIFNATGDGEGVAPADDNVFYNSVFYNYGGEGAFINNDMLVTGLRFVNCVFDGFDNPTIDSSYNGGTLEPVEWDHCNFSDTAFAPPLGPTVTEHSPAFVGPFTSAEGFALEASSALVDIGVNEPLAQTDYLGHMRPAGAAFDLGAFEFGADEDATAPQVVDVVVDEVDETSFRVSWTLDEPASGHLDFGPTAAYGSSTPGEANLLAEHVQRITGRSPGSEVHFTIVGADMAGNAIVDIDRVQRTAEIAPDTDGSSDTGGDSTTGDGVDTGGDASTSQSDSNDTDVSVGGDSNEDSGCACTVNDGHDTQRWGLGFFMLAALLARRRDRDRP